METLEKMDKILGIVPKTMPEIPENIKLLFKERERARIEKNFAKADFIRQQINALGWQVDDTKYGPFLKKRF